eukprot:CAMPEP_0204364948 /NCGR_PEP_ID=MMETSP0469-20131031/41545_1 /ASSEMBLY_ACC=CAM_ASM_000384 /TAXON_ID=2969 /ORGANISM="Oxyrrhis marina" /LENGTH=491 /DNA_ID=CAMNT_0051353953 /DNA_START=89 /DNA_END=1561 /DNA_ORIENTATION=+
MFAALAQGGNEVSTSAVRRSDRSPTCPATTIALTQPPHPVAHRAATIGTIAEEEPMGSELGISPRRDQLRQRRHAARARLREEAMEMDARIQTGVTEAIEQATVKANKQLRIQRGAWATELNEAKRTAVQARNEAAQHQELAAELEGELLAEKANLDEWRERTIQLQAEVADAEQFALAEAQRALQENEAYETTESEVEQLVAAQLAQCERLYDMTEELQERHQFQQEEAAAQDEFIAYVGDHDENLHQAEALAQTAQALWSEHQEDQKQEEHWHSKAEEIVREIAGLTLVLQTAEQDIADLRTQLVAKRAPAAVSDAPPDHSLEARLVEEAAEQAVQDAQQAEAAASAARSVVGVLQSDLATALLSEEMRACREMSLADEVATLKIAIAALQGRDAAPRRPPSAASSVVAAAQASAGRRDTNEIMPRSLRTILALDTRGRPPAGAPAGRAEAGEKTRAAKPTLVALDLREEDWRPPVASSSPLAPQSGPA